MTRYQPPTLHGCKREHTITEQAPKHGHASTINFDRNTIHSELHVSLHLHTKENHYLCSENIFESLIFDTIFQF